MWSFTADQRQQKHHHETPMCHHFFTWWDEQVFARLWAHQLWTTEKMVKHSEYKGAVIYCNIKWTDGSKLCLHLCLLLQTNRKEAFNLLVHPCSIAVITRFGLKLKEWSSRYQGIKSYHPLEHRLPATHEKETEEMVWELMSLELPTLLWSFSVHILVGRDPKADSILDGWISWQ